MADSAAPLRPLATDDIAAEDGQHVTPQQFRDGFGEDLRRTLDLSTWSDGEDLSADYRRIEAEVRDAVAHEDVLLSRIRTEIFPQLGGYKGAPPGAGIYECDLATIERIHRGLLFNGGTEACTATRLVHDTVPLTIFQIGVSLVSYQGSQGVWRQRLFRRDLRLADADPVEEMMEILERRRERSGPRQATRRDTLSDLAQRGIMAYAERAILLKRSSAVWRMGHGSPAPYELLTGSGNVDLMIEATRVIRELVEQQQKFVYIAGALSDRAWLTIGQALRPLEYAIVSTLYDTIYRMVEVGHSPGHPSVDTTWDGQTLTSDAWLRRFRDTVAPKIVLGVYRATQLAPAQLFYAHVEHADIAACLAMADSVLQAHRGFPLLIDLADNVCRSVFGSDTINAPVSSAYADVGAPWRYQSERR